MPDPMAPAIAYFYCDDDEAMERIALVLIKKGEWFDVRRASKHRWSICFNAIITLAPIYQKKLIAIQPQETEIERNVANYKAKRAAELRGNKTRGR
jgi:hypothetical protein